MALTNTTLSQKVFNRISHMGESATGIYLPEIELWIGEALAKLAVTVSQSEDFSDLQKSFVLSISGGVCDLSATAVLVDVVPLTGIVLVGSTIAKPVPHFAALYATLQPDLYHYALKGRTLQFKNIADGLTTTLLATGTGILNFIPTIAEVPDKYEPQLIEIMVEMALQKKVVKAVDAKEQSRQTKE